MHTHAVKREHFEALRESLNAGKLTLFEGTLVDCLKAKTEVKYTVASLLDHMDWMPPSVSPFPEFLSQIALGGAFSASAYFIASTDTCATIAEQYILRVHTTKQTLHADDQRRAFLAAKAYGS
jgi:hypothetical protein